MQQIRVHGSFAGGPNRYAPPVLPSDDRRMSAADRLRALADQIDGGAAVPYGGQASGLPYAAPHRLARDPGYMLDSYSRGPALEPPPYRSAGPSDLYDHARHDSYVPAVEGRRERSRSRPYPQEPPPTAGGRAAAAGRPPATSGPPGTEHKLPQAAYVQRQQLRWMLKLRLQQVCFWLTVLVYRARRQPA
jgi:hypothetical protein